jgi:hypothetical protein
MAQKKKVKPGAKKPSKKTVQEKPRRMRAAGAAGPITRPARASDARAFEALIGSETLVVILQIRGEVYRIPFGQLVSFRAADLAGNASVRAFLDAVEGVRGVEKAILIGSTPAMSEGG